MLVALQTALIKGEKSMSCVCVCVCVCACVSSAIGAGVYCGPGTY